MLVSRGRIEAQQFFTELSAPCEPKFTNNWGVLGHDPRAVPSARSSDCELCHFRSHGPFEIPHLDEGEPKIKAADEIAANFLIRQVHQYPHEVTIVAAGPLTNLALAIRLDPDFASLAKELIFMGASSAAGFLK